MYSFFFSWPDDQFIGATMGTSKLRGDQIGKPSNNLSCVSEYLPGGTLRSYLIKNRKKKLPFRIVIQLALDLARGSISFSFICLYM